MLQIENIVLKKNLALIMKYKYTSSKVINPLSPNFIFKKKNDFYNQKLFFSYKEYYVSMIYLFFFFCVQIQ